MARRRWWALPTAVLAAGLIVAGCSSSSGSSSAAAASSSAAVGAAGAEQYAQQDAPQEAAAAPEAAASSAAGDAAGAGTDSGGAAGQGSLPALQDRQVIYTADLQLHLAIAADVADSDYEQAQSDAVATAVGQIRGAVTTAGGFFGSLQQSGSTATLLVRVPATAYEAFLSSAAQFGEVTSMTEAAQDVTDEYTDIANRIATLQASVDRLRAMIAEATQIGDIIALESELTAREADLESLKGRQTVLDDQISLATVSISLSASRDWVAPVEEEEPATGFLGGLQRGWDAFLEFWVGVGAVVGALLPFIPVFALIGLGVWALVRWSRTRRTRRFAALQQPAATQRESVPMDPTPVG